MQIGNLAQTNDTDDGNRVNWIKFSKQKTEIAAKEIQTVFQREAVTLLNVKEEEEEEEEEEKGKGSFP